MPTAPATSVPVFKLYGETRHWPTPDLLHCESIPERSQLHDWNIRPHRHADLVHVLHLASGDVTLELEGMPHHLTGPLTIVVPAMAIHGFRFAEDVQGHIITLAQPLAEHLSHALGEQGQALARTDFQRLDRAGPARRIATLVAQIDEEYRQPASGRAHLLEALIQALVVELSRLVERGRPSSHRTSRPGSRANDKGHEHLTNFQALIEAQYRQQPSIESLAGQLGLTSAHLNTLCRRLADRSALQLLHERLLLEAKRQLTYTNMTIGQISDLLGFSEPAYFTRFFKRLSGFSPRDFRLRQHAAPNDVAPGQAR
ncbi:helix-turn-helix domain-containing protein [Halomonas pacifica]|uniref:AraC family transcriptional regulator n=1 Tax=Bisbaumannia pacifica TaxID=77098 RepID=A0A510XD09_9GAMM|nr:helix-turn-helix domain-containing protein [Halomonas pacifica]MDC8801940.1 helix-turn-helix domain-containing protein [Halomonas pacifica]GEK48951.1 AraC family transcriptional regulator [Halomonas pacifica]